jgi:hypothetical protein
MQRKPTINATQMSILEGYLRFPLEDITESLEKNPNLLLRALISSQCREIANKDVEVYRCPPLSA